MKQVFILKGLNCPNCAAKIERDAAASDEISSASMNLMNESLTVDIVSGSAEDFEKKLTEIVLKYEPDVKVMLQTDKKKKTSVHTHDHSHEHSHDHGHEHGHDHEHGDIHASIFRFIAGAVIFAAGSVISSLSSSSSSSSSYYLSLAIFIVSYLILGYDVIFRAVRNIIHGSIFDENFLMTLSTIGAFCIGEYQEAVAVMLFYQIGELFQDYSVRRSRRSITELMDIKSEFANVLRDGKLIRVSPDSVDINEIIVVKPGEKIPLDGVVTDGESSLNTSALTGESLPRDVKVGDNVLSGVINQSGALSIRVTKSYEDSTVANILELVENSASNKAKTENFITVFARYYTPSVVIASLLLATVPPLFFNGIWSEWLRRAMVFLVVSCPCALVVSVPLAFFGGIGAASKHGILVKGSNYLEALDKAETVVFDKTGTLTKGSFSVSEISPAPDVTSDELLRIAAFAEYYSNHPIAKSVVSAYGKEIDSGKIENYREISGKGVCAEINGQNVLLGNAALLAENSISVNSSTSNGKGETNGTLIYAAVNGKYAGSIQISDEIKKGSAAALAALKDAGVKRSIMLTGDNEKTAAAVSSALNIEEYHSELLPADKVAVFGSIKEQTVNKTVFVGDGINDAPVLAAADVGIAMGALGSDAAIEAADVVLMTDEVSGVATAIKIAHETKKIVIQNIVFSLAVKFAVLLLGALGKAGMWEAVFADVGVALLAVLNSMRILKFKV